MFKYEEFILEKLLLESIVYYSPNLRKLLGRINSPISKDLIGIEGENLKDDISFIDIDETEVGKLTFKTAKSMRAKLEPKNTNFLDEFNPNTVNNVYKYYPEIWKPSRNPIKIGKLVNTFFPGKYTPGDIEKFTNTFKSSIENTGERIVIVEGNKIGEWYDLNKYWSLSSTLGSSCMRGKSIDFFEMYNENPQSVRMVCLLDEKDGVDKLKARALVWKVESAVTDEDDDIKFEYFMDRQYCWDDSEIIKLRNFAVKNGWAYKTNNNHRDFDIVTFNNKEYSLKMTTSVKVKKYSNFPYMDTFKRFNTKTGVLFNDNQKAGGCYILEDTRGSYESIRDPQDYVRSEWFRYEYLRSECIWSERVQSWLPSYRVVNVIRGSESNIGIYPDNYDDLAWSDFDGGEYFHIDDCVWSEYTGDYYLKEDARKVVVRIDSDLTIKTDYAHWESSRVITTNKVEKTLWFQKTIEGCQWRDYFGFYETVRKPLFHTNYKGEYIPINITLNVRKLKTPWNGMEMLSSSEINTLGIGASEISSSRSVLIDMIEHSYNLKENGVLEILREKGHDMTEYDFYLSLK